MHTVKHSHEQHLVATAIAISLLISFPLSALLIREVAAQATHEVKISGFAFVPQNMTSSPGDSITWNNTDPVIHTLWFVYVANGSTYLLSDPILPNTMWTHTFNDAVELQYYSFDKLWITGFIKIQTGTHDVAVTNVTSHKTVIGQNCCGNITVAVENQGTTTENFNVTLYANATVIQKKNITLTSGESANMTFTWNTTGFAKGNYTIKAVADTVPGESDTTDNTLTDGPVMVGVPCDVTGPTPCVPDDKCNMRDIGYFCSKFGTTPSSPEWDANCDVTGPTPCVPDGTVNMRDIGEACDNFNP